MKAKIIIIIMALIMLTWIGIKAGCWADKTSKICEARYQEAIDVLRSK